MSLLADLGFNAGWIYEVILECGGHAAPMGVWSKDLEKLEMKVYMSSKTHKLLSKQRSGWIHLTDGVEQFFEALTEKKVDSNRTDASLKFEVLSEAGGDEATLFTLDVIEVNERNKPALVCRAEHLLLEALIESSKPDPDGARLGWLAEKIKKTAPGSAFEKKVRELI